MSPEKSMFWDTGEAGTDGENPYDQEEYALLFQEMFTRAADQGPLRTGGLGQSHSRYGASPCRRIPVPQPDCGGLERGRANGSHSVRPRVGPR